ncbi:MAG: pyruvate carboxylase subunit B [Planctomycetaceae bacterium]|nr:pyruvate carboxylase subunit B [Planctomycetaceae bacterium]
MAQKVMFTETVLRDANQSLIATRLPYEQFEAVLSDLDDCGYYSLEVWGGATFDSCLRYLDEDPWERLRNIKKVCKKTKLQMLLRGQNLLGYKHYPDDVVRTFVQRSVENGIDVIRIFDALNDLRNLEVSVNETIKRGAIAQVAISYTTSPVHSVESYIKQCKEIENMGATALCIKDMAGVLSPAEAFELVKGIKENSKLQLHVHTHMTTGLGFMTYMKSVEAGADVIDTAISCFSGGTSQPSTETMLYALDQLGYDHDLDMPKLKKVNDFFKPIRDKVLIDGTLNPLMMATDADALNYKIPGGMLSNLVSQLKSANKLDQLNAVLEETPRVRKEMGYPPLVTPLSQMVGVQAATNVLVGERYKNISKEIVAYIKGEYGHPPGDIDPELIKRVLGDDKPYTGRYAETLAPGMEQGKKDAGPLAKNVDDVLSYIVFPQIAEKFFESRQKKEENKVKYTIEKVG